MPEIPSLQPHLSAFSAGPPGGLVVENDRAEVRAPEAQTPKPQASPFASERVDLGSPALRADGEAQTKRTSSSLGKFFTTLKSAIVTRLQAAWDRIAGKPGTNRASTMDTQFRVAHGDVIAHLEKVEPASLAANEKIMDAVFAHAAAQKSPLQQHEVRQCVAAGEKAVNALYKDYRNDTRSLRFDVGNKNVSLPNSQYLTRAISWLIAARVAEAQIQHTPSANATNNLDAEGEIVMPDPGHRLQKFLAGAPSATTLKLPDNATFEHVRLHKDESYNKDNINLFKGIESSYDELQGCIDDARMCLPGAGGAMVFDGIKAGTRSGDVPALRVRFTRSQHMTFERTDEHGAVEKDSVLGNLSQGLSRLWMRPAAAQNAVRSASMDTSGLKETIADPYRKLMKDVAHAGLEGNKVQGFLAEHELGRKIDGHVHAGFDTLSANVTSLLGALKKHAGNAEANDFATRAQALNDTISLGRTAFGDSTSLGLTRVGAERHISLTQER